MNFNVTIKLLVYKILYKKGFGTFYHYDDRMFNKKVRLQRKDHTEIPFIINNFNQLFYLRQLIAFLQNHKFEHIIIIDNNSAYPPLLDYYKELENESRVKVYKIKAKRWSPRFVFPERDNEKVL